MTLNPLNAVSPIDGRYRRVTENLGNYFSEEALIKYRVRVEIEYFIDLCKLPLPQLKNVPQNGLEDRINQTRERKKASGNGGPLQKDPKTQKGEPIQLPDIDPPDIDAPDLPDIDPPTFSESFWKTVLIIVVVALVILLLYWLIRNYQPKERSIVATFEEHEWNPEVISKSELELKLEAALNKAVVTLKLLLLRYKAKRLSYCFT